MSKPPHPFWQAVLGIISQLWRWFGSPRQIAKAKVFDTRDYILLTRFLRGAEAMLRAALFLEAVELRLAGDVAAPQPRPRRSHPKRQTQTKSACFRVLDLPRGKRRGGAGKPIQLRPPTRYYDATPLARRAEIVLRVVKNPLPYVRRLARRLQAQPKLALRINARGASHHQIIPTALWMDTCDSVRAAAACLCDSS